MATTKKNVNKNTVTNKKSATTKRTIPVTDGNETKAASKRVQSGARTNSAEREQARSDANPTKVMCPVCGSEFAIGEHEHTVKNATVVGADSGLGTIYLPVSKRGEALQAAGIDTSKYFAIQMPNGTEKLMTYDENGDPVAVKADDPIMAGIIMGGTVPNRNLFRRWVMSQVFHGLMWESRYSGDGFTGWLKTHGYKYQWEMLIEELHVQARLHKNGDMENFEARNRWFNRRLALAMAQDYIKQLREDANGRPQHKCKGVPYVTVNGKHYFMSDINKKLLQPMIELMHKIAFANTPQELEQAVRRFWCNAPVKNWGYKQCTEWKDAYKGMGAYATMQNLLRFHGCTFPKDNGFYERGRDAMKMLEHAALTYAADGEGWRLFGLMKQCIEENGIDIEKKMKEWAKKKELRVKS